MNKENKNIETIKKIVDSAMIEFSRDGFSGASISSITSNAGVSKGNLYYYFKDKDELYIHCSKKCIYDFKEYLLSKIKNKDRNETLLIEILKIKIDFFMHHQHYKYFFLNILTKKPNHLKKELNLIEEEFRKDNLDLFLECLVDNEYNNISTEEISTFFSVLQCYASFNLESIDQQNVYEYSKNISKIAKIFLNGLRKEVK